MRIHFVGNKGVSMSMLASICKRRGDEVSGSDIATSGHDKANVHGADLVVYSGAIPPDNPELAEAKRLNIRTLSRGEFLGELCATFDTTFAVCGCHGKTTTTAMLYSVLSDLQPTLHIGAKHVAEPDEQAFLCKKKNGIIITEACEYKNSFLSIFPDYCIFTNIDFDHPDCFCNLDAVKKAFSAFYRNCQIAFVNADDKNSAFLLKRDRTLSYGFSQKADFRACNLKPNAYGYSFEVIFNDLSLGEYSIGVKGKHNVYNALACIACAFTFGVGRLQILKGLQSFRGVVRRNELLGTAYGCAVYTDYAHHPAEITSELELLHSLHKRVLIIFQPHTFSRTKNLLSRFVSSLSRADFCVITPTYASREQGEDDFVLFNELSKKAACARCDNREILPLARKLCPEFDCVCFMGAGDIDEYARSFISS